MNFLKLNKKKQQVKNKLLVGVDIGQETLFVNPMLPSGEILRKPFPVPQSRERFGALLDEMQGICEQHRLDGIVVGLESTGPYWQGLAHFLQGKPGVELVFVSCKTMKQERASMDLSRSKNDPKDAYLVSQLMWQGKFMPMYIQQGVWAELRRLGGLRARLIEALTKVRNHIHAIDATFWPERRAVVKDRRGVGKTSEFLYEQCPFPEDILKVGLNGLLQLTRGKVQLGRKKAQQLLAAAENSLGIREGIDAAKVELKIHLADFRSYENDLATVEMEQLRRLKETGVAPYLDSIKGVSSVGIACILGETGDPRTFKTHAEWIKLAGLDLVEDQSGKSKSGYFKRISKVGRRNLRCVLFNLIRIALLHNADLRAPHLRLILNGKKRKQAMVASMCRFLRIAFSLCKKGEIFQAKPERKAEVADLVAKLAERQALSHCKKSKAA